MAAPSRDQALSLLAASNNHGDLAVKLSSLKQARDILSSVDPSLAADLFPYLVELQSSPEGLVRKVLVEIIEDVGLKALEYCSMLIPVLLALVRDGDPIVARQSIVSGLKFYCRIVEEMVLQFHRRRKVDQWLEELWMWMVKFKDVVFAIVLQPGSAGTKLLALKFLETYILIFTIHTTDSEKPAYEAIAGGGRSFNVSCLLGGHPILDPVVMMSEVNKTLDVLLGLLLSAGSIRGSLTIAVVNCLAAIARKRQIHYDTILSALFNFDPNFEGVGGCHTASIRYALRTAFLGFLRCTNSPIVESRERLLRVLRAMNAGDAADQVIRQVDKMMKNSERVSRETRLGRDDQPSSHLRDFGDLSRKRSMPQDNEDIAYEVAFKRIRHGSNTPSALQVQVNGYGQDSVSVNEMSPNVPQLDSDLTPVEKMIAMIGALLAEGERGAESLEILISNIHPDLLGDIVITNMRHLPKTPPPLTRLGNLHITQQNGSQSISAQVVAPSVSANSVQSPVPTSQVQFSSVSTMSSSLSETSTVNNFPADSKRDPRRDPRRLDPRRVVMPTGIPSIHVVEDIGAVHFESDGSGSLGKPVSPPAITSVETQMPQLMSNADVNDNISGSTLVAETDQGNPEEEFVRKIEDAVPIPEVNASPDQALSPLHVADEDSDASKLSDGERTYEADSSSFLETNQNSPTISNTSTSEEMCVDLPVLPVYVDMTEEQQISVRKLAVERIIKSYDYLDGANSCKTWMAVLARLVAQLDAGDDVVVVLQKQIVLDHEWQKGHDLVLHILYHLHSLMVSDSVETASIGAIAYEKFLLAVAKSLLNILPASDKSFSRLLGEVPFLPDASLKLLDDLCYSNVFDPNGNEIRDGERVTQGLGAVWGLILGRPNYRQACLSIALKCAVHSQDDIRAKAIRLVANKLYQLNYMSEHIEKYATDKLLSVVDQHALGIELSQSKSDNRRAEGEVARHEMSTPEDENTSGAQLVVQNVATVSFPEAQRLISLYFSLCTKKPSLLRLVFDIYGKAPKSVRQAFHRHIPVLIRAVGPFYSELLHVISDPPQGSENLLTLVLQILTQEMTPSADLIATVKHLYETKLKDVSILIPMLSSLSKDEVLPIFPRLVDLPIEKFQTALAHILQGSAHTGPALTPAEVLVAIHDISPEKDGLALKKIIDACSTCFEQRTVFTQQVLAKALNQMVDQTPLPLLFMRTVIQAIDAFPKLVDFVMEILSKLVNRQVWRMPKLWVGFLKCVSQTQPHSFHVLLQLPSPQLESALNKHAKLRGALAAYASQPSRKASVPRSTLAVLGLANESHLPHGSSLHPSDTNSSVHGSTMTR
ncbi:uncharacterized protein LOC120010897 isoform X1 [Tripterygium wilfordii]|uniref:uncharacterized protein LOC120010897 isoform X1 n=3 Tax=Tripterygium wilfordii TaxID=458696 RepID=UPI0018F7E817|nr:uncharacterized protein LOC120010897 isoform X1 [Tripterygium wilfordii]